MTKDEFYKLEPGDVIQNELSGQAYIVMDFRDDRAIAVRMLIVSNPAEWEIVRQGKWNYQSLGEVHS